MRYFYEAFMKPLTYGKSGWDGEAEIILTDEETFALREYRKGNEYVLMFPPVAGHHPNRVKTLVNWYMGFTNLGVAVIDLFEAEPCTRSAEVNFADLIDTGRQCIEYLGQPHLIGICMGGYWAAIVNSFYSAKSLTVVNAPFDTSYQNELTRNAQMIPNEFNESVYKTFGVRPGSMQVFGFLSYTSNWKALANSYWKLYEAVMNNDEEAINSWHEFQEWLLSPYSLGRWHLQAFKDIFKDNLLIQDKMKIGNEYVKLGKINNPVNVVVGNQDVVTEPRQCMALLKKVQTKKKLFVARGTGHYGVWTSKKYLWIWKKIMASQ